MEMTNGGARLYSPEAEALAMLATAATAGKQPDAMPEGVDLDGLYRLAKNNYITGIVYPSVRCLEGSLPDAQLKRWRNEAMKQAAYSLIQRDQRKKLGELLEKERIKFIGLKGYVLNKYYPEGAVRSCADIDICIPQGDRRRVRKALALDGYKEVERGANHDTYEKNNVSIEVHHQLHSETPLYHAFFKDIFDRAELCEGSEYQYSMSNIDFNVFQMTHAMRHFVTGGIGFRAVTDQFITSKYITVDRDELKNALSGLKLWKFYCLFEDVTERLFSSSPLTEDQAFIVNYMISGGVFGTELNNASMKHSEYSESGGSTFKYVLGRTFLSFYDMSIRYPVLKKAPILLPFCHIHRWFKAIFNYRGGIRSEITASNAVTSDDIKEKRRVKSIICETDKKNINDTSSDS